MQKTSPTLTRVLALRLTNASLPLSLRIPFVRRCVLARASSEEQALMLDLSLSGAYVRDDRALADRERLVLAFRVPGNERLIRLPCIVAWVNVVQKHPVHSLPPGCGLRFIEVTEADRELMAHAIRDYCLKNPLYRQYL